MASRILVVDDDTALAEMIGIVLRTEGFDPVFCEDGAHRRGGLPLAAARPRPARPHAARAWTASRCARASAPSPACRSSCSPPSPTPPTWSRASSPAPTTTWSSRSTRRSSSPASARACARAGVARRRARCASATSMVDVAGHEVRRGESAHRLTPLEFDLLLALASKPQQVFTREMLLEQVWGYHYKADTRLVNVHVQRLRAKVEQDPDNPKIVMTVRGVGYRAGAVVLRPMLRERRRHASPVADWRDWRRGRRASRALWRRSLQRPHRRDHARCSPALAILVTGVYMALSISNDLYQSRLDQALRDSSRATDRRANDAQRRRTSRRATFGQEPAEHALSASRLAPRSRLVAAYAAFRVRTRRRRRLPTVGSPGTQRRSSRPSCAAQGARRHASSSTSRSRCRRRRRRAIPASSSARS